jgi:protein involved in polysaccharide export with SLBB domain
LAVAGAVTVTAGGCASRLDQALLADRNPAAHRPNPEAEYCLHCPDVLQVSAPGWSGDQAVGPDGRVRLGAAAVRVDGQTPAEAARTIAGRLDVDPGEVQVRVVGFNSQRVYVHGEVAGLQRAVPYQGPETVVDLLQRLGGITPGAAPEDIQVVRSRVADGRPPEVFHVHLEAILAEGDQSSNVRLEPFDQVYVGQTRRHCVACCLPPWMRSLFTKAGGAEVSDRQLSTQPSGGDGMPDSAGSTPRRERRSVGGSARPSDAPP